ncbi:mitochondrial cardiolipin hydrolase-like [Sitodiplosis mosellana]|uniref:mitochondrial cardiolipin hydrolase-like n=1 Tax=Sitodiplosis mosellana TaxID=263140 RepID=UPI0024446053|nr:mitochondrial cardiolipin hydrolase-like [Sitodiplosis mosellana]
MTDEKESNDFLLVPALVGIVVLLLLKVFYDLYRKLTKSHHEVYFVMMGEPECCNPNDRNMNPGNNCRKYCMGKLLLKIMNRINGAKSSICVAMYNFSNHRLADCLLRAHRRGVKIRLVTDKSTCESGENKTQAKRLKDAGISVRISGEDDKLMHHKFCLIDGTSPKGVLITGSLNWTYGGLSKNCENVAFISNGRVQQFYREAFDHIWNKFSTPYYPRTSNV